MKQLECMIGVDVGGTNTRIGLVDRSHRLLHFDIASTALLQKQGDFCGAFCEVLSNYIRSHQDVCRICGVSLGFPSTIDKARRTLLSTPNIQNMDGIAIVDEIESRISLPVFVEKDVNMLLCHDVNYFSINDHCVAVACYIGTGLGNSVYLKGEILRGKNGVAGELGHIPVMDKTELCNCGNTACMENYASGRYLESLWSQYFSDVPIHQVFTTYSEHAELIRFVECLSLPIATEINIFDPDYVILGGGILQMENFPKQLLEQKIVEHSRKPFPAQNLEILYSPAVQENGVIGAAIYGFCQLDRAAEAQRKISKFEPQKILTIS